MLSVVDAASSNSGDLALPLTAAPARAGQGAGIPQTLLDELWLSSQAEAAGLTRDEFGAALAALGHRLNYGQPSGAAADPAQRAAFLRALHLPEFALAQACALGRDPAWERFLSQYRAQLTQAAIAIAQSATLGHELADSLYAELYGLRAVDGERRSPLASYSGRGSLLGWLRATLAQRHVDHLRRTRRESPLEAVEAAAPEPAPAPQPDALAQLAKSVAVALGGLSAEERFLLACYYLDHRTILEIGRLLGVHEATISRRLKRLAAELRIQLLRNLRLDGLSRRAAEEALGTDPRDIEINLRALLQTSQSASFSVQASVQTSVQTGTEKPAKAPTAIPDRL